MSLRREVDNQPRSVCSQYFVDYPSVSYVATDKGKTSIRPGARQIASRSGVGELVQCDHPRIGLFECVEHEIRTDKSSSSAYQDCIHRPNHTPAGRAQPF